jgi:hypothetical protein
VPDDGGTNDRSAWVPPQTSRQDQSVSELRWLPEGTSPGRTGSPAAVSPSPVAAGGNAATAWLPVGMPSVQTDTDPVPTTPSSWVPSTTPGYGDSLGGATPVALTIPQPAPRNRPARRTVALVGVVALVAAAGTVVLATTGADKRPQTPATARAGGALAGSATTVKLRLPTLAEQRATEAQRKAAAQRRDRRAAAAARHRRSKARSAKHKTKPGAKAPAAVAAAPAARIILPARPAPQPAAAPSIVVPVRPAPVRTPAPRPTPKPAPKPVATKPAPAKAAPSGPQGAPPSGDPGRGGGQ